MEPELFSFLAVLEGGWIAWLPFLLIAVLLVLSALVSGSEVAFFSLTPADIQGLENERDNEQSTAAERVIELLNRPDPDRAPRHLLATILVLNNLTNIIIILISTVAMERLFPVESLEPWIYWTLMLAP